MNRYEIKFDISDYNLFHLIKDYKLIKLHPKRIIQSIYFDTINNDYFINSEEGQTPRKKIRLRKYNNNKVYSLEFKYTNSYHKTKTVLKNFHYNHSKLIKTIKKYDVDELIYPKIVVTYLRYYYLSPIGRITLDKNIFFQQVNNYLKFSNGIIRDNKTILELKIEKDGKKKFDKTNILKFFNFKEIRNSKYCNGVNSFISLC